MVLFLRAKDILNAKIPKRFQPVFTVLSVAKNWCKNVRDVEKFSTDVPDIPIAILPFGTVRWPKSVLNVKNPFSSKNIPNSRGISSPVPIKSVAISKKWNNQVKPIS